MPIPAVEAKLLQQIAGLAHRVATLEAENEGLVALLVEQETDRAQEKAKAPPPPPPPKGEA